MLKKLFAAALCGIVIASIASHADAAGPGSFARGFGGIERSLVASLPSHAESEKVATERREALSALDHFFSSLDQSRRSH